MISSFLNRITMYRLMLYYLLGLWVLAIIFSAAGLLPYSWGDVLLQGVYLSVICYAANQLIGRLVGVRPNTESQWISALILTLIVGPLPLVSNLAFLTLVAVLAMAGKYILVWKKRHIFNPASLAVVLTAVLIGQSASWWIGSQYMFPFLLVGGLLILKKVNRFPLVIAFLITYVIGLAISLLIQHGSLAGYGTTLVNLFVHTSLLFFATVMLVEPLTSPTVRSQRIIFGILAGVILVAYQTFLHVGYTLELALITANLYALAMRTEGRLILVLKERKEIAKNISKFTFTPSAPLRFRAGQYLEWTLPHSHPDDRGVRRYFTIASPPTEETLSIITKFATDRSSTFKSALADFKPGDKLVASHLEGDFVLPTDATLPIVFIAGGIGVTPFHSMIHWLVDANEKRDIALLYSARTPSEFIAQDLFTKAEALGVKTTYTISEDDPSWKGPKGLIDDAFIKQHVPDWQKRLFYVSGPEPMVAAFMGMLTKMGVPKEHIKHDDFPGYDQF